MYLIKYFCKPFVCGCKDFVRSKETIEEEQMANHCWKEEILLVVVSKEGHWMLRNREEKEDIIFISKPFFPLVIVLKKAKDILTKIKINLCVF
jgi:peptidase E